MSFEQARSAAAARLWASQDYPVEAWAADMYAVHQALGRLGVQDPAVASAAALAPLVARPAISSLAPYLDGRPADHEAAVRDARSIVSIATHAAAKSVTEPRAQTIMATIERDALSSPASAPLADALNGWRDAVPRTGGALQHPLVAASIAATQLQVLRVTQHTLDQVEPAAGTDPQRTRDALARTTEAWVQARQEWRAAPPQAVTAEVQQALVPLGVASRALHDALRAQVMRDPRDTLGALMATSVGGQDIVAQHLQRMTTAPLEATAVPLATAAQALADNRAEWTPKRPPLNRAAAQDANLAPAPGPARVSSNEGAADEFERGWVDPSGRRGRLSPAEEVELAARRDAGTLAAASLAGDPAARALTRDTPSVQLQALVSDGIRAKAELVDVAGGLVLNATRNRPPAERDDAIQQATLAVVQAAETFDPTRARWSSWVIRTAEWELIGQYRKSLREPATQLVREANDERLLDILASTSTIQPETAYADPHRVAESRQGVARIRAAVEALPPDERAAVRAYLAHQGEGRSASISAAEDLGISTSTVRRRVNSGLESLRTSLLAQDGQRVDAPRPLEGHFDRTAMSDTDKFRAIREGVRAVGVPAVARRRDSASAPPGQAVPLTSLRQDRGRER